MRPLAALPFAVAKMVFTAAAVAAWMLAARRIGRAGLVLTVSALFFPLYLHLERGQIDLFVLVLALLAIEGRDRPLRAGAALAAAILLKAGLMGLLPVLALGRRWRMLGG